MERHWRLRQQGRQSSPLRAHATPEGMPLLRVPAPMTPLMGTPLSPDPRRLESHTFLTCTGSDWMLFGGSPPGGSSPEDGSPLGTSPEAGEFWGASSVALWADLITPTYVCIWTPQQD